MSWVKNQYEEERMRMLEEVEENDTLTIPTSIRLPASAVAYYTALASRFNQSRNSTITEILNAQINESLKELSPHDRVFVGKMADQTYREMLEKNGGELIGKYFEGIAEVYNEAQPAEEVWHTGDK